MPKISFGIVDSKSKPSEGRFSSDIERRGPTSNAKIENINIDDMTFAEMNCEVENDKIGNESEEDEKAEDCWQDSMDIQGYVSFRWRYMYFFRCRVSTLSLKPGYRLKKKSLP